MGKFYDEAPIPDALRRNYDVYDRIKQLGINLGSFDEHVRSLEGRNIAGAIVHESGLVYLSGVGTGKQPMNDDPERVKHGQERPRRRPTCRSARCTGHSRGGEGDLNDVLYTVKALGMVVSTDVDFNSGPAVVNGYSKRWQSVFGGGLASSPRTARMPAATGAYTPAAPSAASPAASRWSRR